MRCSLAMLCKEVSACTAPRWTYLLSAWVWKFASVGAHSIERSCGMCLLAQKQACMSTFLTLVRHLWLEV